MALVNELFFKTAQQLPVFGHCQESKCIQSFPYPKKTSSVWASET